MTARPWSSRITWGRKKAVSAKSCRAATASRSGGPGAGSPMLESTPRPPRPPSSPARITTPAWRDNACSTESMAYFSNVSPVVIADLISTMYSAPSTSKGCSSGTPSCASWRLTLGLIPYRPVSRPCSSRR